MTALRAWLADLIFGPACPDPACRYRARGHRSLAKHRIRDHG